MSEPVVVVEGLPPLVVVTGVPARMLRHRSEQTPAAVRFGAPRSSGRRNGVV